MAEQVVLKAGEQRGIAEALLKWLRTCPYMPEGMKLAYQNLGDSSGMSLHTLKGTIKRKEYVDGSYEGYYPFAIYLRDMPDSTNTRLECTDILDKIGAWVDEQDDYPELDDNRIINSINMVSNATLVKRFENGVEDYMATFELLFEKE